MGGLISGILGGGQSAGQQAQQQGLQQSRAGLHAYRPEMMQAHLNLLSNASKAYQPMNNALETMYGGRPTGGPPTLGDYKPQGAPMPPPMPQGGPPPQGAPQGRPGGSGPPNAGQFLMDPLGLFR